MLVWKLWTVYTGMFAVTAILSCVFKIRGLFKSTKCGRLKMSNLKLSARRDFIFFVTCKMEENYNNMTVARLRALAREHRLRGYSRLRKAELITFLRENLRAQEPVENHQPVGRTRARSLTL